MIFPTLLATSSLALTASAFLVPLEVANTVTPDTVIPNGLDPKSQTIDLDCSTCPFALASTRDGVHEWTGNVKNDLVLNFTAEDKQLKLNGIPFYPDKDELRGLTVRQQKKDNEVSTMQGLDADLRTSYSMEYKPEKRFPNDAASLVPIEIQILALENQDITVDSVEISAIKNSDGELRIISLVTNSNSPLAAGKQCQTVLCRMLSILNAKIAAARAKATVARMRCMNKLNGWRFACMRVGSACWRKLAAISPPSFPVAKPHHERPAAGKETEHHDHHDHHHHHGVVARVWHVMTRVFGHIMLPILVGIGCGVLAGAVGMLVGQLVIFLWAKIKNRRVQLGEYERVGNEEGKDGLPRYEELEGGVVVGEKDVEEEA